MGLPWAAVVLASVAAIFLLPKKYMSSALVLVESEKVPESFIAKVATRDPGQRLDAVRPEILSRTRLERVIAETAPYPELSTMQAVEKLCKSTVVNVSGNDGFTIAFYHRDAHKAQEVTDRLARLFIDETIKSREEQVEGAVDFLTTQVRDARRELETKDARAPPLQGRAHGPAALAARDQPRHHADAAAGHADGSRSRSGRDAPA